MFQEGCFKLHHAMSYGKVAKIWILKGHEAMIPMPNKNIEVEIIQMPPMESDENKVQHSYLVHVLYSGNFFQKSKTQRKTFKQEFNS